MIFVFSVLTTLLTLFLLFVGGMVNPTGSSLACPDWPTCYGSFFPAMVGGVFFEHGHRMVATGVGLCTVVLMLWIFWLKEAPLRLKMLGVVAGVLVVFQGLLGGITVLFRLPPWISVSHLVTSMIFLCVLTSITWRLGQRMTWKLRDTGMNPWPRLFRWVFWVQGSMIFIQIVLGALVRHLGAGRICGNDFIGCVGMIWPSDALGQLHMVHRIHGYGVGAWVMLTSILFIQRTPRQSHPLLRMFAWMMPWLVCFQVLIGMGTVATHIHFLPAALHLLAGAILLSVSWVQILAVSSPTPWIPGKLGVPSHG
jgi:heme A synthase